MNVDIRWQAINQNLWKHPLLQRPAKNTLFTVPAQTLLE